MVYFENPGFKGADSNYELSEINKINYIWIAI